jgi:CheY-like chemotaxis protein/anti-sigma regulatory factor (Ser/Thr protein kinase)
MREFYRPKIEQEDFNQIDLNKIIRSTIDLTKHRWKNIAESEGIVIRIQTILQDNLPGIKGNESEIREALTNLIINACDAMPKGGQIIFKSYSLDENIFIEIQDTGIGMAEDTINHCLDPFFTTKGDKGTGLGLSMVYGITQRQKGEIKIESEPGKGTTIKLVFPKDDENILNTWIDEREENPSPLKILFIDDNIKICELVSSMLETGNHYVKTTNSGKTGLEMFFDSVERNDPFDVVITDLGMSHLDGKSVAEAIKGAHPHIPIILMTGWGAFIEKDSIEAIDYILKKPITIEELNKALTEVLKRK